MINKNYICMKKLTFGKHLGQNHKCSFFYKLIPLLSLEHLDQIQILNWLLLLWLFSLQYCGHFVLFSKMEITFLHWKDWYFILNDIRRHLPKIRSFFSWSVEFENRLLLVGLKLKIQRNGIDQLQLWHWPFDRHNHDTSNRQN